MNRQVAAMAMRPVALADDLFAHEHGRLARLVDLRADVLERFDASDDRLAETQILLAGWGCPRIDADVLERMPRLRAVLFAGGSASAVLDARRAADRGIVFTNAGEGNAQAVAEYTLALILLAGKRARLAERLFRERRAYIDREIEFRDSGNYGRVVGLIGASRIGRRVAELLRPTDLSVVIYDPYASDAEIARLGARRAGLDDLLATSDVVSLHAPATAETHEMIGARELALLRDGATLINTARGALVDHEALRPHVRTGRIDAVLDVTAPEPLPSDDELWELPNVSLTPHIAGATGNELRRLGRDVVDELERFVAGVGFAYRETVPA